MPFEAKHWSICQLFSKTEKVLTNSSQQPSHYEKKEIFYPEFVMVKSCVTFWCKKLLISIILHGFPAFY